MKIIAYEYEAQNFTCSFDANPPPISIYWITNETTIVSRKKFRFCVDEGLFNGGFSRGKNHIYSTINIGTEWNFILALWRMPLERSINRLISMFNVSSNRKRQFAP